MSFKYLIKLQTMSLIIFYIHIHRRTGPVEFGVGHVFPKSQNPCPNRASWGGDIMSSIPVSAQGYMRLLKFLTTYFDKQASKQKYKGGEYLPEFRPSSVRFFTLATFGVTQCPRPPAPPPTRLVCLCSK